MTVGQLIEKLKEFDPDDIAVCEDSTGGWDNIETVYQGGCVVNIVWGGGSPFSDE